MRSNFPVLSEELNDIILEVYSKYVHLLGYDDENGSTTHIGVYDRLDTDGAYIADNYIVVRNDFSVGSENEPISKAIDRTISKINFRGR